MKLLLIFIVLLFSTSFVSATKLGISPGNLIFNGSVNEKICRNIIINTDYKGVLIGESKWIDKVKEKRDIKDYNLNAINLNINIEFPESINMSGDVEEIEICIIAEKPGKYNGAIIYKTADSYAGVGSWIEIKILGNENENSRIDRVSGASIGIISKIPKERTFIQFMLSISLIALFIVFAFSFIIYKKRVN